MDETGPLIELVSAIAASEPVTWVLLYLIFRETRHNGSAARSDSHGRQGEG